MFLNAIVTGVDNAPTPLTREEFYLAKIIGRNVQIPTPLTRYEIYLARLAGMNMMIPSPHTRLEYILTKACGVDVETPTPLTREEIYWARYRPAPPVPTEFTVSYYSQDGSTLLGTEAVENGGNAIGLQDTPTKPDTEQYTYTFAGWSNTTNATTATSGILNNITADKSVYAAFSETEKTFEVDFYNGDTLLETAQNVAYNGTATYTGSTPTKASTAQYDYTFAGWTKTQGGTAVDADALTNVTANRSVYAVFTRTVKDYTVIFYNEQTLLETASVPYGSNATYTGATPTRASTAQYSYNFLGWNADSTASTADSNVLKNITANRAVYAIFTQTERSYTVSYYSQDGQTLIDTESVVYGHNASFSGTTPTKASTSQYNYTFVGWNTSTGQTTATANVLDNITADKSVYAAFSETARTYTVYFYNESTLLQTVTGVLYGGSATYTGSTPTKTGYRFIGWDPSPTNVTEDISCYAQFIAPYITDSWEVISQRSAAGTAQNYYSVGDCKPVALNGTMGTLALDTTLYVYILGFNHNSTYEPNGITFGGFKTAAANGVDVCLVDSKYNSSDTSGTKYFNMSHKGNYNYGGWAGSDMRYDILGSTDVQPSGYGSTPTASKTGYDATSTCATSPVANTLMSCLPSDLRAVMKPMTKYTDNKGNSSNVEANVTSSIDYLPLLSEYEVQGARSYANQYEQNKQARYAYYAAGKSKVKYQHSATSSTARWWCRSASYNGSNSFCIVDTDGSAAGNRAGGSRGVAPCFLV